MRPIGRLFAQSFSRHDCFAFSLPLPIVSASPPSRHASGRFGRRQLRPPAVAARAVAAILVDFFSPSDVTRVDTAMLVYDFHDIIERQNIFRFRIPHHHTTPANTGLWPWPHAAPPCLLAHIPRTPTWLHGRLSTCLQPAIRRRDR